MQHSTSADARSKHKMVAPEEERMTRDVLEHFSKAHALAIRLEYPEEFPCGCTRYGVRFKVYEITPGKEDHIVSDASMRPLEELFEIREDSSVTSNCWCGVYRSFRLGLFPSETPISSNFPENLSLLLDRPCEPTCWLGKHCHPQKICIHSNGKAVGHAERECRFWDCFLSWTYWTRVFDSDGNTRYMIRSHGCGDDCCAPSIFKRVYTMNVFHATNENEEIASLRNIWRGWQNNSCSSPSDTHFVVVFPTDASEDDKKLLFGALFLQDFCGSREQGTLVKAHCLRLAS